MLKFVHLNVSALFEIIVFSERWQLYHFSLFILISYVADISAMIDTVSL
jgi:hypothetical protein